jgi:hypothetical protein
MAKLLILLVILAGVGIAEYVTYHRYFQSSNVAESFGILHTSCHDTSHLRPLSTIPIVIGTSGTILFNCGDDPAFVVDNPGIATPIFSLPQGYSKLTIVSHVVGNTACQIGSALVSNQHVNFTRRTSFDYCAAYSNPPLDGLASFTLTWTRER